MTTFRCHDADACAFGQKPCPTPRACGCEAPAAVPTDRELLELAAKAAGIVVDRKWQAQRDSICNPETASLWVVDGSTAWNPLTDDGDALRLAVGLDIIYGRYANTYWARRDSDDKVFRESGERNGTQNPHAATRRAIVRAAAAIGATLP